MHLNPTSPRHFSPQHACIPQQTLGEDWGIWVVEYWTRLRRSQYQVALEWTDHPEKGSSFSAQDGDESDFENQELVRAAKTSAGWQRAYRGRRAECVVGSLQQGKPFRHASLSFHFGAISPT